MQNFIVSVGCSELRSRAWHSLSGNWGRAALATLVTGLITSLFPVLLVVISTPETEITFQNLGRLYGLIVNGPVALGYTFFLLNMFRGFRVEIGDALSGFRFFGKAFLLNLLQGIFILLWCFLLIVPGIIAYYRYAMSYQILCDNPEKSPMDCIRESKEMMVGNKMSLFILDLSYIGWWLLGMLGLGIPLLWIHPYWKTGHMAFYEEMRTFGRGFPKEGGVPGGGNLPPGGGSYGGPYAGQSGGSYGSPYGGGQAPYGGQSPYSSQGTPYSGQSRYGAQEQYGDQPSGQPSYGGQSQPSGQTSYGSQPSYGNQGAPYGGQSRYGAREQYGDQPSGQSPYSGQSQPSVQTAGSQPRYDSQDRTSVQEQRDWDRYEASDRDRYEEYEKK